MRKYCMRMFLVLLGVHFSAHALQENNKNAQMRMNRVNDSYFQGASAYNTSYQSVQANGVVTFDQANTAFGFGVITPPSTIGQTDASSFIVAESGYYLFQYQVRGKPIHKHHKAIPLVFEITYFTDGQTFVIPGSRYASDHVLDVLYEHGTEVVNGFAVAYIHVPTEGEQVLPVIVQLHNVTDSEKDKTELKSHVEHQDLIVNASMNVMLIPSLPEG